MTDIALKITNVHQDPYAAQRMTSGKFKVNKELNEEWIDILNAGPYVLNMQGRILACMRRIGSPQQPSRLQCLKYGLLRANTTLPLHPGKKIRIYTGEQPRKSTKIEDHSGISKVLWAVLGHYLWVPAGNEAHIYFSLQDMKNGNPPLSRYLIR